MQHLAIIPDGNRRWAVNNKMDAIFGHKKGVEALRSAVKVCIKNGIKYLSFYTFSLENFKRTEYEKNYLFNLLITESKKILPELVEQGVCVKFLGDRSLFSPSVLEAIQEVEQQTSKAETLQLNLLFGYGAQQEIVYAARLLAQQVKEGKLAPESITVDMLKNNLWTGGIPDPDLVIRTGNVSRTSNFLLYQTAYSEWFFLDPFWPEVTEALLEECLHKFTTIKRNFGT